MKYASVCGHIRGCSVMFRKMLMMAAVMLGAAAGLSAQTAVEQVIIKYEDTSGARDFIAQGTRMILARRLLMSTQVAPIAKDVDELYILKMQDASQSARTLFENDLNTALKSYEYYGKQPSRNGEVEIYVHYTGPESVDELVIYNPSIYSLNSLYGHFSVQSLLSLDKTSGGDKGE